MVNTFKSFLIRILKLRPIPLLPDIVADNTNSNKYLNLGCGNKIFEGNWVNFDQSEYSSADEIGDFNLTFPFGSQSFDGIYLDNVLEHVDDVIHIMNECYRVLKQDGKLEIIVPHEKSVWAWADPTHTHVFNQYSFYYFLDNEKYVSSALKKSYGIKAKFDVNHLVVSSNSNRGFIHIVLKKIT